MAANDPDIRRALARAAAKARVAGLTPEQRRAMTAAARAALRDADLRQVDDDARRAGEHPLPEAVRAHRANMRMRERARLASVAAAEAHRRRLALAELLRERRDDYALDRAGRRGIGTDPALMQMAARR